MSCLMPIQELAWLQPSLTDLVVVIIGAVIAELALYRYFRRKERAKIIIKTVRKENKLGFEVSVNNKTLKDARVVCNGTRYKWEENNGAATERRDIYVGDSEPASFYPYEVSYRHIGLDELSMYESWTAEVELSGGVLFTVTEILSKKTVCEVAFGIQKDSVSTFFFNFSGKPMKPTFKATIRIIAEGIDEVKDYPVQVGFQNITIPAIRDNKPLLDFITYSFVSKS